MFTLRPHQIAAKDGLRASLRSGKRRPILQASTGFGKTIVAIDIIQGAIAKRKRVVFVVDRLSLVTQTSNSFLRYGIDHGVIQANHPRTNPSKPIQIASVQTLVRRKLKPEVDMIVVDEAHAVYNGFVELLDGEWSDKIVIGLSATPWTRGLGKIYDDLVVVETTQGLIDKGYLVPFRAYGPSSPDLKGVKVTAGDYNQKQLAAKVNTTQLVGEIVDNWAKLGDNRQTVVFAVNVAHSEDICERFNSAGIPAAHIDAYTDDDERERVLAAYDAGEYRILCNVGITTKGWDSPVTSCCVLARPTKSLMLFVQMAGRVLRTSEGKRDAIILDHGGNFERLGFPTDDLPEYLCNGEKQEASERKKQEDEEKLPKPCPACTALVTTFPCACCGHVPKAKPMVSESKENLVQLTKATMDEKRRWFNELLGYGRSKGYADGWASNKYREKFGVWPKNKSRARPTHPSLEVKNWITHKNIAWAKGRAKRAAS